MLLDKKIATRQSYGEALKELGKENENIVVLDADLSTATKTEIFAKELKLLVDGDVMPLAYGQDGTYSLKYNILFDKLFGWNLIGQEVCEREVDYYIDKSNRYGVPLDTRKDYTKSDWILWCAALTDNKEKCEKLYYPIVRFLTESPSREPFIDWYGTEKGEYIMFRNRTVQGGIFAPLLRIKGFSQGDR